MTAKINKTKKKEVHEKLLILLKDKPKWEDPGYNYLNILKEFVEILNKYYEDTNLKYTKRKVLKNLVTFNNKLDLYRTIFSWAFSLGEKIEKEESVTYEERPYHR